MKALFYKELKLCMHPICWVFMFMFPLMILIPNYPIAIGFIYILSCYPILFLGANKGQQSNDLLYSTLLPVRKKDIVLARIFTCLFMQVVFMLTMSALYPVALAIRDTIRARATEEITDVGLSLDGFVSCLGIALIGYAIADLIFFPIYYKNGKSIVMSTLLTIIGFIIYLAIFTIVLPMIPAFAGYNDFLSHKGIGIQFGILGGAIVVSAALHFVVYKVSSKKLEHCDF